MKVFTRTIGVAASKATAATARHSTSLAGKHFVSISQLSSEELEDLIDFSITLKNSFKNDFEAAKKAQPMLGKSMSMIFQKRSTRTRVSTETGVFKLGGHALMLGPQDVQLGVNETLRDTALVLSRFNDVILARVFAHSDIEELAAYSTVPVINALSDMYHPLQTLADLMTLKEHFPDPLAGKSLAWVGDGNNVLHDLMIGSIKLGMNVRVATPAKNEYNPNASVLELAQQLAAEKSVVLTSTHDPVEAVTGCDVVVTDTWVSMGQEEDAKRRKIDFAGYQVTAQMMEKAQKDAVFLHCLPRKPEEVTDEVFYSSQSLVFPEAENRMWTLMAVTLRLLDLPWNPAK